MALLLCFRRKVRYSPPLCNLAFLKNDRYKDLKRTLVHLYIFEKV